MINSSAQQASIGKLFVSNVFASIVAVMITAVYVITDGMFVGHYLGKEGLAAIGIAYPVFMLLPGIGLMLGIGGGALISMYRGANDSQRSCLTMATSLVLIVVISLLCSLYLALFSGDLLQLQSENQQILKMAQSYLSVYQYSAVMVVASSALTLFVRNDDSPNIATVIMVLGALLNIVLNYWFLGALDLGMAGVAYASAISMAVVCVLCVGYFYSTVCSKFIKFTQLGFDLKLAYSILLTGSSVLAMYLYSGFVIALHNKLFSDYGDSSSLSAFSIVGYIMTIYYMLAEGVGNGVQPLLSFFYGQGNGAKNGSLMKITLWFVGLLGFGYYLVLNLFPDFFIQLFSREQEVTAKALIGVNFHLAAMFLEGIIVIASVYFASIQRGGTALFIALANMFVQLPLLYLLPLQWGEFGIWLALPLSNVVMILLVVPLLYRSLKVHNANDSISAQPLMATKSVQEYA